MHSSFIPRSEEKSPNAVLLLSKNNVWSSRIKCGMTVVGIAPVSHVSRFTSHPYNNNYF
jgi:hypothetical protein